MTKNELQVIAKIILVAVGIYVLLQICFAIFSVLLSVPMVGKSSDINIWNLLILTGIYTLMTFITIYLLFFNSKKISQNIIDSAQSVDDTQISFLAVAFRLICVVVGIYFFYWTIPHLSIILYRYTISPSSNNGMKTYMTNESIIEYLSMLIISLYFALGAPHFVRWQVKMTLKQCNKSVENQKPWG